MRYFCEFLSFPIRCCLFHLRFKGCSYRFNFTHQLPFNFRFFKCFVSVCFSELQIFALTLANTLLPPTHFYRPTTFFNQWSTFSFCDFITLVFWAPFTIILLLLFICISNCKTGVQIFSGKKSIIS